RWRRKAAVSSAIATTIGERNAGSLASWNWRGRSLPILQRSNSRKTRARGGASLLRLRLSHGRFFPRVVLRRTWGIVGDRVKIPVPQVEPLHFFSIQRPRPTPPEDRELIAGLIHCPVTIDAARNRERRPRCAVARD